MTTQPKDRADELAERWIEHAANCKLIAGDGTCLRKFNLAAEIRAYGDERAGNAQLWKDHLIDALVVHWVNWDEDNPRKAIHDLLTYNSQIALDPLVSEAARDLIASERKAREEAEALVGTVIPAPLIHTLRLFGMPEKSDAANWTAMRLAEADKLREALRDYQEMLAAVQDARDKADSEADALREALRSIKDALRQPDSKYVLVDNAFRIAREALADPLERKEEK